MRLLFLTPQPPFPPDQGAKLRNYHLMRIAAQAGHEVDLLTFSVSSPRAQDDRQDSEPGALPWCSRVETVCAPPARRLPVRALQTATSKWPDLLLRLWSPKFREAIRRLLAEPGYDLVQVEGLELARYLPAAHSALTVFDDHNVEHLLQQRAYRTDLKQPHRFHAALYSFLQWRRLRRWEAWVCRETNAVLAASEPDAAKLRAISARDVVAVPNGVDLAAIPFRQPPADIRPDLLFDASMGFRPNVDAALWFAREILPIVRNSRPDTRFWVVGRDPPPDLVAYNFRSNGVAVTGAVPSVEPYWSRAGVYVLPMRIGGGLRFKALQAMARGIPMVSTGLGVEGIAAVPGRDYLHAERPAEFAAAILRLLDDASLRLKLATYARETVSSHDWTRISSGLVRVYDRLEKETRHRS